MTEQTLLKAQRLIEQGHIKEAAEACKTILEANPQHSGAYNLLGLIAFSVQQHDTALTYMKKAHELAPDELVFAINLAKMHNALKHPIEAILVIETINRSNFSLGELSEITKLYEIIVESHPDCYEALLALARNYMDKRRMKEGADIAYKAHKLQPENPQAYPLLGFMLEHMNALDQAKEIIDEGLARFPNFEPLYIPKGMVEKRLGNPDEAITYFTKYLSLNKQTTPANGALCENELGKLYHRHEKYHKAFTHFEQARRLQAMTFKANKRASLYDGKIFDHYKNMLNKKLTAKWQTQVEPTQESPIFLVGFPRSGTTLLEQMLASHPQIITTQEEPIFDHMVFNLPKIIGRNASYPELLAELSEAEKEKCREFYWQSIDAMFEGNRGDHIVLDKNPLNIANLGAINSLFPHAKVIFLLRDPRDAILSCFMQLFQPWVALSKYSTLEQLSMLYSNLMDLWLYYQDILTLDVTILKYEDLVGTPEKEVKTLLSKLDIGWDEEILHYYHEDKNRHVTTPSYTGVMQPVYHDAIGRWKHYKKELQPIIKDLKPFIKAFNY